MRASSIEGGERVVRSDRARRRGGARIKELINRVGVYSVLECVGTQEAMWQAIHATRPGGAVGYVGVPHGVALDGWDLFFTHVRLHGRARSPMRRVSEACWPRA